MYTTCRARAHSKEAGELWPTVCVAGASPGYFHNHSSSSGRRAQPSWPPSRSLGDNMPHHFSVATHSPSLHPSPATPTILEALPLPASALRHNPAWSQCQRHSTYMVALLHPSRCALQSCFVPSVSDTPRRQGAGAVQHSSCVPLPGDPIHQPLAHSLFS